MDDTLKSEMKSLEFTIWRSLKMKSDIQAASAGKIWNELWMLVQVLLGNIKSGEFWRFYGTPDQRTAQLPRHFIRDEMSWHKNSWFRVLGFWPCPVGIQKQAGSN